MEIVIHGTKDGYRQLFSTDSQLAYLIAKDVRHGANEDKQLGQSAYSLAFAASGYVYTKYTIVKDAQRSNAIGTIAFTLFLNCNKVLEGSKIKNLLDDLSKFYSEKYIINNSLNRGERNLIREDWTFVNDILSQYKEQDKIRKDDEMQSGTKDAAFIYYKDERELQEYFDKPFQEEYNDYEQILFVKSNLRANISSPLNALRNSGVELKDIDLKNEYYYLSNYNRNKAVRITANRKLLSDARNNNSIREKSLVEISYSKDEQCFYPIEAKGTLSNHNSEIHKYLHKDGNQIYIDYDALNNPEPKTKTITLEIKDRKGDSKSDVEISCKNKFSRIENKINDNKIVFKGGELIDRWSVTAKKDDFSGKIEFTPKMSDDTVVLILEEKNIVAIKVKAENTNYELDDFEVWTKLTGGYKKTNQLEFIDDQISENYTITIRKYGYEDKTDHDFCPRNFMNKDFEITLKKKTSFYNNQTKSYNVMAGDHGKLKNENQYTSNTENGSDVKDNIVPEKGYIFTHFDLKNETLIAQYKKKKNNFLKLGIIAGLSIVFVFVLYLGITLLFSIADGTKVVSNSPDINRSEIKNYVEGNELILETLNSYKNNWNRQKPEIEEIGGGFLGWFDGKEKQPDSINYKKWDTDMQSLKIAIIKRKLINEKDFELLKKLEYFSQQENFINTIEKIDSINSEKLNDRLGDVTRFTLNQIADSINIILTPNNIPQEESKKQLEEQKKNKQKNENPITEPEVEQPKKEPSKQKVPTDGNSKISKELKGSSITKEKLKEYEKTSPKFKSSIQLYLDFFEKVKNIKPKSDYDELLKIIKKDNTLKNSELKKFLAKICKNDDEFVKFRSKGGKPFCKTLDELKSKIK